MIEKRTWEELQDVGLLWWINRALHLFGWSIVFCYDERGKLLDVYPAKVKFRGFDDKTEEDGYLRLTNYMSKNGGRLVKDITMPDNIMPTLVKPEYKPVTEIVKDITTRTGIAGVEPGHPNKR